LGMYGFIFLPKTFPSTKLKKKVICSWNGNTSGARVVMFAFEIFSGDLID